MNSKKSSMQGRKPLWLEYLMIIVGTGLMSLAINSVFDGIGNGNRWIFRHRNYYKSLDKGTGERWDSPLGDPTVS